MRAVVMLVALSVGGCVTASTHETLIARYDAKVDRLVEMEKALAAEQGEAERLQGALARMQQRVAELTRARSALVADRSELKASIAEMQRALDELERRKRAAEARVNAFRNLVERFQPLVDAGRLRVKMVGGRMVVELPSDVLFASGKAKLSADGETAITAVAGILKDIPKRRYQVEGHTDDVRVRGRRSKTNWELAAARSLTVVKVMVAAGLEPSRVSGASFSQYRPVAPNATDDGKQANRRIEIVVVPDLAELPGFEELQRLGGG
jgi:chemotaxis protein MotB